MLPSGNCSENSARNRAGSKLSWIALPNAATHARRPEKLSGAITPIVPIAAGWRRPWSSSQRRRSAVPELVLTLPTRASPSQHGQVHDQDARHWVSGQRHGRASPRLLEVTTFSSALSSRMHFAVR